MGRGEGVARVKDQAKLGHTAGSAPLAAGGLHLCLSGPGGQQNRDRGI